jgi:hypothetical protein
MDKDSIACLESETSLQAAKMLSSVRVFAVVHQDGNVGFLKAVDILDVFFFMFHIIVATTQFTLLDPHN